jgi:hypothetical protein
VTTSTNMGTPIIDARSIKVSAKDRPLGEAKAEAIDHALARLIGEAKAADDIVMATTGKTLVTLVDAYRALGEPCSAAIATGLVRSVRGFAKAAERDFSRFQRGARIASHWVDGESTDDCVERFMSESKNHNLTAFVAWIGGGNAAKTETPAMVFARACRKGVRDGLSRKDMERMLAQAFS